MDPDAHPCAFKLQVICVVVEWRLAFADVKGTIRVGLDGVMCPTILIVIFNVDRHDLRVSLCSCSVKIIRYCHEAPAQRSGLQNRAIVVPTAAPGGAH